jgi:hypothetical protein
MSSAAAAAERGVPDDAGGFAAIVGIAGGLAGSTPAAGRGTAGRSAIAGGVGLNAMDGRTESVMVLTPGREPAATLKASLVLSTRVPIMTRDTQTMIAAMMMRKSSMPPPPHRPSNRDDHHS